MIYEKEINLCFINELGYAFVENIKCTISGYSKKDPQVSVTYITGLLYVSLISLFISAVGDLREKINRFCFYYSFHIQCIFIESSYMYNDSCNFDQSACTCFE